MNDRAKALPTLAECARLLAGRFDKWCEEGPPPGRRTKSGKMMYLNSWSLQAMAQDVDDFVFRLRYEAPTGLADDLKGAWKGILEEARSLDRRLRNPPKGYGWIEMDGERQSLAGGVYSLSAWLVRFAEYEDMGPANADVASLPQPKGPATEAESAHAAKAARAPGGAPAVGKPEAATVPEGAPALGYRFAYEPGGHWLVQYEGRKVGLFPNDLGFRYIHELIRQQERPVSALVLRDHYRLATSDRPLATGEEAAEDELYRVLSDGKMADKRTLAQVLRLIEELEAERKACTDPEDAAQKSETIAKAKQYLNQVTDPTGKLRPMPGDPLKNAADSVRAAINAAIQKIKKSDKSCGLHFHMNIRRGASSSYTPNPPVQWDIS